MRWRWCTMRKVGHPGGDLSSADMLVTLYLAVMRMRATDPGWAERDRFIMSKGHCSASFYATLAEAGLSGCGWLETFMDPLSKLNGHPDRNKVPAWRRIPGALGHGLPIAVGCALAAKMQGAAWRAFVLTGDGELQEGSNWEAAMTAAHYGLDNLVLIVDRNRIQQGDFTEKTIRMDPLPEKWEAFGWAVVEVDGHDYDALRGSLREGPLEPGKPTCVIANTVKGRGRFVYGEQAGVAPRRAQRRRNLAAARDGVAGSWAMSAEVKRRRGCSIAAMPLRRRWRRWRRRMGALLRW